MKKISLLMTAAIMLLSSCGIASRYASSQGEAKFQDGIYNSAPSFRSKTEKAESQSKTDALVEETKASKIYLFGDKKDTVMIPENMSASIRYDKSLASTVVTVGENPYSWQNNIDPWYYYTPYSIGSSWYWSRHYDPWYGSSWYWNSWAYSPWRYHGWYDPFYYGGYYDPWYYGYGGWYGYMYPYYAGWYGGWDPYWHHHHHYYPGHSVDRDDRWSGGGRKYTGSDRVFTSRVSTRRGTSSTSRVSRAASTTASRVSASASTSGSRNTATRVTSAPARTSAKQSGAANTKVNTATNHRKPGVTVTRPSSATSRPSGTASYRNGSTVRSSGTSSSSSYRSGSSSPSYRSSSQSTTRSSGYSGGGSSRSYSGGGGSRSGGSSGGRR